LPGREAHPEGGQGTAACHHQIANALLPQADPVFDDAATRGTAVHVLGPQPAIVQGLVGQFLFQRQLLTAWFLGRQQDLDLRECERQEAQILQEAVAYLLAADNDYSPLLTCLRDVNQPVIRSRNPFSRPHPARLAYI
jgi:hypothetical protein